MIYSMQLLKKDNNKGTNMFRKLQKLQDIHIAVK